MSNLNIFTIDDLFALRYQLLDQTTNENIIINRLKRKLLESGMSESDANNLLYIFYLSYDIPMTLSEIEQVQINIIEPNNEPIMPLYFNNLINLLISNINNINTLTTPPTLDENIDIFLPLDNNMPPLENDIDDMPPLENDIDDMPLPYNDIDEILPLNNTFPPFEFFFNIPPYIPLIFTFYRGPPQTTLQDVIVTTDINSIEQMNVLKITEDMNEKCLVCMEEMNEGDIYIDIKCKHVYHKECLTEYLTKYNHICPTCRMDIGHTIVNN